MARQGTLHVNTTPLARSALPMSPIKSLCLVEEESFVSRSSANPRCRLREQIQLIPLEDTVTEGPSTPLKSTNLLLPSKVLLRKLSSKHRLVDPAGASMDSKHDCTPVPSLNHMKQPMRIPQPSEPPIGVVGTNGTQHLEPRPHVKSRADSSVSALTLPSQPQPTNQKSCHFTGETDFRGLRANDERTSRAPEQLYLADGTDSYGQDTFLQIPSETHPQVTPVNVQDVLLPGREEGTVYVKKASVRDLFSARPLPLLGEVDEEDKLQADEYLSFSGQVLIWLSALRGAVAFVLALSLPNLQSPHSQKNIVRSWHPTHKILGWYFRIS